MKMTTALRRAIAKHCVVMPGAFNAATARLIERAGFPAVYASGAGLANATAGVPDIGLLSLSEVAQLAGYMVRAVKIPILLDADTGFGAVRDIPRTIRTLEQAGVAGIHLEDQVFPKRCGHLAGKEIVPIKEMTAKLKAAAKARKDKDFLLIARTDARAVEGLESAVERARAYLESGADAIFPEALESAQEFRAFANQIAAPLLANMTEFGRSPLLTVHQLGALGYRMIIFPMTAFRVAMKAEENLLKDLNQRGTQKAWLPRMQTRQELYSLLDYEPAREWTP
ncbi:MAG TPA: methylisocitrate lyase [Tepidisphaeraceae bacterium]|jgi:methylisocitrate lyase|nr:methylisocitrate lyase [Tepidisphaeraceae bacterium]